MIWSLVRKLHPKWFCRDLGSAFSSERWRLWRLKWCSASLKPLRKIYREIKLSHQTVSPNYIWKEAIEAVNCTMYVKTRLFLFSYCYYCKNLHSGYRTTFSREMKGISQYSTSRTEFICFQKKSTSEPY